MELKTPRDVGRHARGCRRFRRLRQCEVARAVGVSRQWLGDLEMGKPTLEIGLVLRAFEELGLDLTVQRREVPPAWTIPLTTEADHRESQSLYRRRTKRLEARRHREAIRAGNVAPDPVADKGWREMEDFEYMEMIMESRRRRGEQG